MLRARLELARLSALAPKTSAATNYAISALSKKSKFEFIELAQKCLAGTFAGIILADIFAYILPKLGRRLSSRRW